MIETVSRRQRVTKIDSEREKIERGKERFLFTQRMRQLLQLRPHCCACFFFKFQRLFAMTIGYIILRFIFLYRVRTNIYFDLGAIVDVTLICYITALQVTYQG